MPASPAIADDRDRAYPGDVARGEIKIIAPGRFDENGPRVQLLEDEVEFPSGRRGPLPRVTRSPRADDGVVIAPIDEDDRVVLVRQFRHAPRIWMWEMPRGGTPPGRPPASAIHEELIQEIGYQAIDAPYPLGRVVPDSGTLAEIPYLVAVRVRPHPTQSAQPEPTEAIACHLAVPYEELWTLCISGAINDACTLAATLRLRPHFSAGRFQFDRRYIHQDAAFEYRTRIG